MANNSPIDFQQFRQRVIEQLHQDIEYLFAHVDLSFSLQQACHYAMTGKGKKVRPLLVASSFATVSSQPLASLFPLPIFVRRAMLAVELIHVYSLVHDDLPCMDDDELRRGRATCHIVFDEATALLVGDALQSLAFEVLTTNIIPDTDSTSNLLVNQTVITASQPLSAQLVTTLAPRARRMVTGQMQDLEGEQQELTYPQLKAIHKDKTGALIEASVLMGAVCASSTEEQSQLLLDFAQKIGLAFQVQDDILDVVADTEQLGKPSGSDEKLDKSTYVKLMGVEQAKAYASELFAQAKQDLFDLYKIQQVSSVTTTVQKNYGYNSGYLEQLADRLWERER